MIGNVNECIVHSNVYKNQIISFSYDSGILAFLIKHQRKHYKLLRLRVYLNNFNVSIGLIYICIYTLSFIVHLSPSLLIFDF